MGQDREELERPAPVEPPVAAGRLLRAVALAVGLGLAILLLRWWLWG